MFLRSFNPRLKRSGTRFQVSSIKYPVFFILFLWNVLASAAPGEPKAPTNLTAQLVFSFPFIEAKLTWENNATDADGFGIERSTDTGEFLLLVNTQSGVTSYTDTSLMSNHTYCYEVYAFSTTGGGNSGFTNEACVVTPGYILPVPINLSALAVSPTQIQLTWSYATNNESGFGILGSTDSGTTWSLLTSVGAGVTYFLNTGLTDHQTYCYEIYAFDGFGETSDSNEACATAGPLPTAVQESKWLVFP